MEKKNINSSSFSLLHTYIANTKLTPVSILLLLHFFPSSSIFLFHNQNSSNSNIPLYALYLQHVLI